jgi:short-subunit dehydrogenase
MSKTALVTGASSGIGYELCKVLAAKGYDLIITARNQDKLHALAQELAPMQVKIIVRDLSKENAPKEIFVETEKAGIFVDVLINNAGFGDFSAFEKSSLEKTAEMLHLNIRALTEMTRLFGAKMVERGSGKVVNIASTAAFMPCPYMSAYFASKHYVLAFVQALDEEWKEKGVRVITVCPGFTRSQFQAVSGMPTPKFMPDSMIPDAKEVAVFTYQAMKKGKRVAVHGFSNTLTARIVKFVPTAWVMKVMKSLLGGRR